MSRKTIWWCYKCGYEVPAGGRCHNCGEVLLPSPLPELAPEYGQEEVGYRVDQWDNESVGRLITALVDLGVCHRFEDEELIVLASDEQRVDRAVQEITSAQPRRRRQKDLPAPGAEEPSVPEGNWSQNKDLAPYPPQNWPIPAPQYIVVNPQPVPRPLPTNMPKDKSVGAALVLTFLFGPLGLFYLGAVPGIIGLFVLIPIGVIGGLLTFGAVGVIVWFLSMIWAVVAAGREHSEFQAYLARGAR